MRICLVMLALAACGDNASDLDVSTDTGVLYGAEVNGIRHFYNIPYAAPPVGPLRWRPPQLPAPWSGVRDARVIGTQCPQSFSLAGAGGDEDCLILNVWSPPNAHDLPVMVWLHGGAFVFGSGNETYYSGEHLASTYGVIVVTLNYRLGAYGFLAHPALTAEDPAYPSSGNYGLDDQRAALEWVQRNIHAFGGDSTNVTLFGESAGGFSTCAEYISPRSHGLFASAIVESGLCASDVLEPPLAEAESHGMAAAAALGCPGSDASVLDCLRDVSSDQILSVTGYPMPAMQMPGGAFYNTNFVSPAEPNIDGFVMPMTIRAAFASGAFEPRPLAIGNNHDEGTLLQSMLFAAQITDDADYHDALARRFGEAGADAIIAHYPTSAFPSPNRAIAEVSGDAFFVCPTRRTARGALAYGAPIYRYMFQPMLEDSFEPDLGVFHSSEIPFVFGEDVFPLDVVGDSGAALAGAMQRYWTRIAKLGNPNGAGNGSADIDPIWPSYDASDTTLILDNPISTTTGLKSDLCDFWDATPLMP